MRSTKSEPRDRPGAVEPALRRRGGGLRRRSAPRFALAAAVCASALGGCGDDGTGAGEPADVAGSWNLTAELSDAGLDCALADVPVLLLQTGDSLVVTSLGGAFSCPEAADPTLRSGFLDGGSGVGAVNGRRVTLRIAFGGDTELDASGELSGQSISGAASLSVSLGPNVGFVDLTGAFDMTRLASP